MNTIWNRTLLLTRNRFPKVQCYYSQFTKDNWLLAPQNQSAFNLQIHTSETVNLFWEPYRKGGYNRNVKRATRRELILEGLKGLKAEIVMWKNEVKEKLESDPILVYRAGETDLAWDFNSPEALLKWKIASDSDHNEGYSRCTLEPSLAGHGLFSGVLLTNVPQDGKIKRAGYCNISTYRARKSFKRETSLDWSQYNTLVIRFRGDGRSYLLNLATEGFYDIWWFDVYHYILYTRGGPHWQTARISFSKFFMASKGRVQDRQCRIPLNRITSMGISVAGRAGHEGAFSLEIDYIGLEFDPACTEEFAYEFYKMPKYVVNT